MIQVPELAGLRYVCSGHKIVAHPISVQWQVTAKAVTPVIRSYVLVRPISDIPVADLLGYAARWIS